MSVCRQNIEMPTDLRGGLSLATQFGAKTIII